MQAVSFVEQAVKDKVHAVVLFVLFTESTLSIQKGNNLAHLSRLTYTCISFYNQTIVLKWQEILINHKKKG